MKFENQIKNKLWIAPAIIALLIALVPTFKYQWPLSWDIFYHIIAAQVYSQYGFTLTNHLINPGFGTIMGYPPLFSLILAFLVKILEIDYFQVARLLQPSLAFSVVLSVSYVGKEFYDDIAGISAGFLILSSYLFSRLVSPLPETMALIFLPLAVYFYYKSIKDKNYLYALISGLLLVIVLMTHQGALLNLSLVITAVAIILGILRMKFRYLTAYIAFLILPIITVLLILHILFLNAPGFIESLLSGSVPGFSISLPPSSNEPISNLKYIAFIGISLLFAVVGSVIALWKRRDQDIIVITWLIITFLISKAYWFDIDVLSIRLLIYLLIPISILGGLGLSYFYNEFKKKEFPSKKVRSSFLISTLIISALFAVVTVENPMFPVIPKYTESPQIAPPTNSDVELVQWFAKNKDKNYVFVCNNYYKQIFLIASTGKPTVSMEKRKYYVKEGYTVFVVLDKRLKNFSIKTLLSQKAELVYENEDYYVFNVT